MSMLAFLVAFFRVAPPVTRPMRACLWFTAGAGCLAVGAGVARTDTVLTPLLVLQIFAASSGFTSSARRGFYDLALSRGVGLTTLLAAHWLASVVPGVLAWLAVAAVERLASPHASTAVRSGSVLAFTLASTIPWGITSALPRFAAAIGWLVLLVTSLAVVPSGQLELVAAARDPHGNAWGALAVIVYPMALLGFDAGSLPVGTIAPGVSCAAAAVAIAMWVHGRGELPLESGA